MSKYRKQFLAILKPIWAERLPDWKSGLFSPAFYSSPDATFSLTRFDLDAALRFHLYVEFSSKRAGEFTGDIFITDSSNQLDTTSIVRTPDDIPLRKIGAYRIGHFIFGGDTWWHLRDEAAESKRFWESRGLKAPHMPKRRKRDWYAKSYDVPEREIMREAAVDFTTQFASHVPRALSII